MSLNKKTRKNLIIASVTAVLVVGFALGLWFFVQYQSDQKTVEVQPVSYLSTSYWGDTTYSSGTAASDSTQEIYPSTEQTISDIYVTEGQQVSVGDPLLQYDKTKLELDVEAKDIAVKQAEIELDDAEDELKKLRNTPSLRKLPIIMVTAKSSELDTVRGLDCGADDYLTKPFFTEELLARVRALSRRQGDVVLNELSFGDLTLNLSAYTLQCGAKSVRLGRKEFEVIRLLLSNPKIILSKETLLLKIWGSESEAEDNNVEAYISFLRKKLAFLHSTVQIATARKLGYHLEENAHAE